MIIEKVKQLKENKLFKIIILVLLALIIILYFRTFFTSGVYFNDTFLKKESLNDETHYTGKGRYGDIQVAVKGKINEIEESSVGVSYYLPNNNNQSYTVHFNYKDQWHLGTVEIINENGKSVFEGRYQRGNIFLYDNKNEPIIEINSDFSNNSNKKETYNSSYKVPLKNIVEFSLLEKETLRGDIGMLFYAVIILMITIIDIKSPLFYFTLSHFIDVKDPEPTDFYIAMQHISWVVSPILALILLIVAI